MDGWMDGWMDGNTDKQTHLNGKQTDENIGR